MRLIKYVNYLLKIKEINPADNMNYAIGAAASNGHLGVVERLVEDKRVNPADSDNHALRSAIGYPNIDLALVLLTDERVKITDLPKYEQELFNKIMTS